MTDPRSPVADFYPLNFSLDSEGKRQDWEAVVVLEFVDVPRLRHAEATIPPSSLSPEEVRRNEFGPLLHFAHSEGTPPPYHTPFPNMSPTKGFAWFISTSALKQPQSANSEGLQAPPFPPSSPPSAPGGL